MRLQLPGLFRRALRARAEERLNLCVPGGKETARMLKTLYQELGSSPSPPAAKLPTTQTDARRCSGCASRRARPFARQSGRGDFPVAHAAQQARLREGDLARRIRPRRQRARLRGRRRLRHLSDQRSGAGRRGDLRRSTRRPTSRSAGATLARGADRRRLARAGARHAVPALLLHHRRRAAAEGEGACRRRGPGWRRRRPSTCSPRCRNFPACGPTRKPSSRRSIRCSRGSIRSRRRRRSTPAASR